MQPAPTPIVKEVIRQLPDYTVNPEAPAAPAGRVACHGGLSRRSLAKMEARLGRRREALAEMEA